MISEVAVPALSKMYEKMKKKRIGQKTCKSESHHAPP